MMNGQAPPHITPLLPQMVATETNYNLRNRNNLRPRFTRIEASLNSFFPNTTRDWNNLPVDIREAQSLIIFKYKLSTSEQTNQYFKTHRGRAGVWLSRIRMGISGLNGQRFTYNLITSPTCPLCNRGAENAIHYFWDCPNHAVMRNVMTDRISTELGIQANRENILSICLHGNTDNEKHQNCFNLATEFIKNTTRFK
jgi:hypothetical protein